MRTICGSKKGQIGMGQSVAAPDLLAGGPEGEDERGDGANLQD
jgi:hypothetical protein